MCGIFGILTSRPRDEAQQAVLRAMRSLAHRGPDDEGVAFLTREREPLSVAFGHRRLSILDLSEAGHQPMRDEATGNWITYNGEVFNFRDLRRQLEARGLAFHSESDTEVLLKSYALRGLEAIRDWRGMFAFGLWEPARGRLLLVRDRLGIKPLYYYHDGESFIFASEVRALLATGLVARRLSRAAVESYLAYGSVEQPLTIIENVYQVLPGHALSFEDGRLRSEPYWELRAEACESQTINGRLLTQEIGERLVEAVRLRLVSDVPVGIFLSGGIDSSAVVALVRRATTGTIKTFSVYFKEREFSERDYAELVARRFATEHHPLLVTADEILAKLPQALQAMDQPSIDGINTYVVAEAASQAGLKVALSGLGGDEVFAGYSFFHTIARDEQWRARAQMMPIGLRRSAAAAISAVASSHRATKLSALLRSHDLGDHAVALHRQLFTDEQRGRLLASDGFVSPQRTEDRELLDCWTARRLANCAAADPVNQASALELGGYLGNTLLRDTDMMSMRHSLEVRVPLIDHQVVERLLAVPGQIKLREREPKWLLVEAVGDLPRETWQRPKRGFELPFKHWLLSALREQVAEALRLPTLDGFIQMSAADALWRDFAAGRLSWSRVWSLYVLGEWARLNL
jgi:asparagine synthase (glutamine-hydrolysing)